MDNHAFLIGIAGGTGSGKTSIANAIASDFGPSEVAVIQQDSYYKDLKHIPHYWMPKWQDKKLKDPSGRKIKAFLS